MKLQDYYERLGVPRDADEEAINKADAAMYKIKHETKNGYAFHAPE